MKFRELFLFLVVVSLLAGFATAAPPLQAVPNAPIDGDQVWVIRDGTIVSKFSDTDFLRGRYARIGSVDVGSTFCNPQPQAPAPQPFVVTPPPFETEPEVEVDVTEVAPAGGPDLLSIILTAGGGFLGYYLGRKAANDDSEIDDEEKTPAV